MAGPSELVRVRLLVTGRVQGVGFRYSTAEQARRAGVRGWVRNTHDGAVEVVAEGDAVAIERFVRWCHSGPPGARVRRVERRTEQATGELADFRIAH